MNALWHRTAWVTSEESAFSSSTLRLVIAKTKTTLQSHRCASSSDVDIAAVKIDCLDRFQGLSALSPNSDRRTMSSSVSTLVHARVGDSKAVVMRRTPSSFTASNGPEFPLSLALASSFSAHCVALLSLFWDVKTCLQLDDGDVGDAFKKETMPALGYGLLIVS